jgi:hypothetical protein
MENKRLVKTTGPTQPQPPRSGLVQPVSILTTDIGFAEITAMKLTPSINKLSIILSRKYIQYPWSV